jgi:hypothetical protein
MEKSLVYFRTGMLVLLLFAIGCSKDDTNTNPGNPDKVVPVVKINSPKANDSVGRSTLYVSVNATDDVGVVKVEVYIDNSAVPVTITKEPWETRIDITALLDGAHTVYAKAYDAAGNIGVTGPVTWLRGELSDTQAPTCSVKSPKANDLVGPQEMYVEVQATDNIGVTKVNVFIDEGTVPAATLTSQPWEAIVSIGSLTEGEHSISLEAYDLVGNIGISPPVKFIKGVSKTTLIENVTSANCIPCGGQNETFRNATNNLKTSVNLAIIKYHVWWPRNTDSLWKDSQTWSKPRTDYLFSPIPASQYTAPMAWVGGLQMGNLATDWISQVTQDMKQAAEAKIVLSKSGTGSSVELRITVKGISSAQYSDLRLHTVITESEINYNDGNSEFVHHDVMRTMLPDAYGENILLGNSEEKTFTRSITIESKWKKDNLKAVVFIQSNGSKKILQAARISLK